MKMVKTRELGPVRPLLFAALIVSSSPLLAEVSANVLASASAASSKLGTVQSVIDSYVAQNAHPATPMRHTLSGDTVATTITHFYYKDGQISVSGKAANTENSSFILKGDHKSLRGYLINYDSNKAYEYSTDTKGVVSITEVPISKIVPDLHEDWIKVSSVQSLLAAVHPTYSPMAQRQAVHIGPYNNDDVTRLESKPGSPYVFFLDNREVMSGSTPLNGVSKENMYRMWQTVASIYSPYNLNITTNPAVYAAAKAANVTRTGIIHFYNQDGRSNAPLWAFGTTSAGTLYRNPSSGFDYGYGIGMTAAHEVGHQMGMNHDHGGTGGEYFEGIAAYQWGPIMGNYWMGSSWPHSMWTWSKGEYNTATNFEDDLKNMNISDKVPYMVDDNPSGKALLVSATGAINPLQNFGQIETTGDSDAYTFSVASGAVLNLRIDPIEYFGMLDVDASVVNAAGTVLARSNLSVDRSASFSNLALAAGNYSVVIKGGSEGTPKNGFSNYSSLGYYAMQGSLTGSVVTPDTMLSSGVPLTGQAAATGGWKYYAIEVPAGKSKLQFSINGSNGDADLFAQQSTKPSTSVYTCKSDGATRIESCSINSPSAGKYYLGVYAYAGFSGLTVSATISN
ncbi:pre-peptidase C-terminal domain-containing protein [Undibacterium sp. Ren11W]|uniref:pre-peptidase C-terminal domain-containing protein n=1 Tax=Undibacterium sp. Ren11W TaxID=3413045 RepID=UPI003BF1158D